MKDWRKVSPYAEENLKKFVEKELCGCKRNIGNVKKGREIVLLKY